MRRLFILSLSAALFLPTPAGAEDPQDLLGLWEGYVQFRMNRQPHGFEVKTLDKKTDTELDAKAVSRVREFVIAVRIVSDSVVLDYPYPFGSGGTVSARLNGKNSIRGELRQPGGGIAEVYLRKK
jgi:hypothetical protein